MSKLLPEYDTIRFTDVWDTVDEFLENYKDAGIPNLITDNSASTLFYLLYARYGNNPITNYDVNQWKYKVFATIFQYGPTWEKELEIQAKLRGLTEDEIRLGSKAIYNAALNPSTAPTTASLEELPYINQQNTTNYKKSPLEGYAILLELLQNDVSERFLSKFQKLFKQFVRPEKTHVYVEEDEDDGN